MKHTLLLVLLLLLIVLMFGFAPRSGPAGSYEYKFVRVHSEQATVEPARRRPTTEALGQSTANALSLEGWTLDQVESLWIPAPNNQSEALWLIFRRPRD